MVVIGGKFNEVQEVNIEEPSEKMEGKRIEKDMPFLSIHSPSFLVFRVQGYVTDGDE